MDHFSPVRPAHIRVLVLPVGQILRPLFLHFLHRLQDEVSIVPLADVEQHHPADDAGLLSPTSAPQGLLLYRFSADGVSEQEHQLSPFDLFREPLLVLGVVDGPNAGDRELLEKELLDAAAYLKEKHPRVVHRQLLVLAAGESYDGLDGSNAIAVVNANTRGDPSLRAAVCEASARFLVELSTYAKAVSASPTIQTPGQTARSLQRTGSLRDGDARPGSGRGTPTSRSSVSSPTDEGSPSRLPSKAPPAPATSFDQITGANGSVTRPESKTSGPNVKPRPTRSSSQDRVAVQGFGSSTSQEKSRVRGKSRVGIVFGSIFMMAGHWSEALRILVENTSKARSLSDHLWHAKGLESLAVCMLLLAWSDLEFEVPSICDPIAEREGSSSASRIAADVRTTAEGRKRQMARLSTILPYLSKLIVSLYRSVEGSLELPSIAPAEATVRNVKLLIALHVTGGELTPTSLKLLVLGESKQSDGGHELRKLHEVRAHQKSQELAKSRIAETLAQAVPSSADGLTVGDHIRLLAGIASAYASLALHRKKAVLIKELIVLLTQSLAQARKLGAAEMGIHPAASLSIESGAETLQTLTEQSSGIANLMADVMHIYGAVLVPMFREDFPFYINNTAFGNPALRRDLFRELISFCEASPDPSGVVTLTTSLLRSAGSNSAIDTTPHEIGNVLSREEQMHYATIISRTVAVTKHLGLKDVQAVYWDPFLVRAVEVLQPVGPRAVIDSAKLHVVSKAADQPLEPGNPLLYDPSASRPGTAAKQTYLLVQNESSECVITLQNPFDIPVDIEDLELVTEGVGLISNHQPTTLGPLRLQRVSLMVRPENSGPTKITGCRIKMQSCFPQTFPIVATAWSPSAPMTIKDIGLAARNEDVSAINKLKDIGIEAETLLAAVLSEMPFLALENTAQLESGLMLLEGESRSLELVLRNIGNIAATVFEATDTADVLRRDDEHKLQVQGRKHKRSKSFLPTTTVAPGDCVTFKFRVEGKAGLSSTQANFYYSASDAIDTKHARVVSALVVMTVNAALQVYNMDITRATHSTHDLVHVSFDVRNAWPKSVLYECFDKAAPRTQDASSPQEQQLSPGEIRRIYLAIPYCNDESEYETNLDAAQKRFLERLHVSWRVEEHAGYVDLLGLTLSPETLDLVRGPPVSIVLELAELGSASDLSIPVGTYATIRAKLWNRSKHTGPLLLVMTPRPILSVRDERRLAVAGTLRRILSPLAEHTPISVEFVICPLIAGTLELEAVVRPAQIGREVVASGGWHSRKALTLRVS